MQGTTLEELRELSRRSRHAHRAGLGAIVGVLLLLPIHVALGSWAGAWLAYALVVAGGALLLVYARAAGKERGAFRKVFARMREERLARVIVPSAPEVKLRVEAPRH